MCYISEFTICLQQGAMKLHNQQVEVDSLKGYSKSEIKEMKEHMHRTYDEQLKRITEMVSSDSLALRPVFPCHLLFLHL